MKRSIITPKNKQTRLWTVIAMFLVSMMIINTNAVGQLKNTDRIPSVHATKVFLIYAKKGNFKVFNFSGELEKNEVAKDYRNGELMFIVTGAKNAIFSANTGISDVEFVKDTNSVTFIETTPSGNKHFMLIEDKWDKRERGFKFTYLRNVQMFGKNLRSHYTGIAKPALNFKISSRPDQVIPSLKRTKTFSVFANEGNVKIFNIESGTLIKNEKANDFQSGEIMFIITGPDSATMAGNIGTAKIRFVRDENFLTFIETTSGGNKHIMIIADDWDVKEKGFKFIYVT